MKKILLLALAACLALAPLSAFGADGKKMDEMRIVFTPYDFLLDFMVAMDQGFFTKAGLKVNPVTVQGGSSNIISTLNRGEVDGCFLASSSALVARSRGIDLVQIAGIGVQEFDFYAKADSPVNSLKDLDGKKIATFPKPSGPWLAIQYDIDQSGIKPKLIYMKSYNVMLSSVLNGQIDAATFNPYVIAKIPGQLKKVHTSTISKYLYNSCGWWAKESFIKSKPQAVKKFIKGMTMAREFIRDHKPEAVKILAKYTKLDLKQLKGDLKLPRFDLPVTIYEYGLKKTNDILMQYKLMDKKLDVTKMVEPRFVKVVKKPY